MLKRNIYVTVAFSSIFILNNCGGGGSTHSGAISNTTKSRTLLSSGKRKIVGAKVISNNDRTLIVWKEFSTLSASMLADTYLYKAEKYNGTWIYPQNDTDYIDKNRNVPLIYELEYGPYTNFDAAIYADTDAIIVNSDLENIKNTSGYIGRITVTQYKDGEWKPSFFIDPYGGIATYPNVAMDQYSNAVVTWKGNADQSWKVNSKVNLHMYRAMYLDGVWHPPADNQSYFGIQGGGRVGSFSTVNYRNNSAFITWTQAETNSSLAQSHLYGATYTHNSILSLWQMPSKNEYLDTNMHIHTTFSERSAIDDNGNKLVAWFSMDNKVLHVYTAQQCNGTWHTPLSGSNNYIDEASIPFEIKNHFFSHYDIHIDMALNANGFGMVVWPQIDSDRTHIYTMRFYVDSCTYISSDNTTPINQGMTGLAGAPKVAVNDNGEAALIWIQEYENKRRLYLATYKDDAWNIPDQTAYIGGDEHNLSVLSTTDVSINNNGLITAIWVEEDADKNYSHLFKKEIQLQ